MMIVDNDQGVAWFNAVDDKTSVNYKNLRVDLYPDKPDALGYARHESLSLSESEAIELRDYLNKSYPIEVKK